MNIIGGLFYKIKFIYNFNNNILNSFKIVKDHNIKNQNNYNIT